MTKTKTKEPKVVNDATASNKINNKNQKRNERIYVAENNIAAYNNGLSSRPLKICMITTISKTYDCFVSESARNLANKGFEVTAICGGVDDRFREKNEEFSTVIEVPLERGINVPSVIRSTRMLSKIFKEENFDVIQYSTPNASFCCTLAKGFKNIPVRVYGQWGIRYVGFKGIKRAFFKALEKFTCKGATQVYAVSHKNRELAISEGLCKADKIAVIGKGGTVGVDFKVHDLSRKEEFRADVRGRFGLNDDNFVFGFIGRLNKDKGGRELITAFKAISENYKDARLMVIGGEESAESLDKSLIEWVRNSKSVIITGDVRPEEVPPYLAACDLVVHPTYREGFSMVLQEAMAMRLPIITTDIPGPSEVIEDGISGVLVPSHNDKALYEKMVALMQHRELCEEYAANGRDRVELYFERPIMLSNIYSFYCNLLGLNDGHIKLMYLTADPLAAKTAEAAGVDRIFLDLEILGKFERQGHLDTVVSHSNLDDVKRLREVITKAELLVRCNPVHPGLKPEIDRIVNDGADIIMLPYFKTVEEVKTFLDCVGGRVPTVLLFETAEAVEKVDEILELDGISEVYIGLNDLHLSYKMKFMFELLADGTVERLCRKFREKGVPYGFGGVAKIGEGQLPSEYIIGEHKRLGSTAAILSRTFRNEVSTSRPVENLSREIELLRRREKETAFWTEDEYIENRNMVLKGVEAVLKNIEAKQ